MLFAQKKEMKPRKVSIDLLDGLEDVMQGDSDAFFDNIIKKEEEEKVVKKEEEEEKRKHSRKVFESAQRKLKKKEEREQREAEQRTMRDALVERGWMGNMFRGEFINVNLDQINNYAFLGQLIDRFDRR